MKNLFHRISLLFVCTLLSVSLLLPSARAADDDPPPTPPVTESSDENSSGSTQGSETPGGDVEPNSEEDDLPGKLGDGF